MHTRILSKRLDFLLRPDQPALLYSLRTTAAALLALGSAMLLGLNHPFWAPMTALIISQPVRGMVLAKGFYRIVGTCVGGAVGALLLVLLVHQPALLILALALWLGLCGAATNLLSGIRSYGAVLAAVTAALLALLAFGHPDDVVALGVDRLAAVLIGILVSMLMALLFVAQSDRADWLARSRRLTDDGLKWGAQVLRHGRSPELISLEHKQVVELARLQDSAVQILAASPRMQARAPQVRRLLGAVLSVLSIVRAVDRLGNRGPGAQALADMLDAAAESRARRRPVTAAARAVLIERRKILTGVEAQLLGDYGVALLAALAAMDGAHPLNANTGITRRAFAPHRSWPTARRTALRTFVGIVAIGAVWRLTGWAGGGPMLMAAAIMCAIHAAHPEPAVGIRRSLLGAMLAFIAALAWRLGLPHSGDVALLALCLAPILFVGTLTMANGATAIVGTEFSMMFLFMSQPGVWPMNPPEALLTVGLGIVSGVALTTVVFAVVLPTDPLRRAQTLNREIVYSLKRLATAHDMRAARRWRALAYQRVLQLELWTAQAGQSSQVAVDGGLAALTVGLALLRLQRNLRTGRLSAPATAVVEAALQALQHIATQPHSAQTAARSAVRHLDELAECDEAASVSTVYSSKLALTVIAEALAANSAFFHITRAHPA